MFRYLRKHSIKWQLLSIGIIVILGVAAISIVSYLQYTKIIHDKNNNYTKEIMLTMRQNIGTNVDTINRIMPNIGYNDLIQAYILEKDPVKKFELFNQVSTLIVNLKSMKQGILDVMIVGLNGNSYNCNNCEGLIEYDEIPERTSGFYAGLKEWNSDNAVIQSILAAIPIYSKANSEKIGQKIGFVLVMVDVNGIAPQLGSMSHKTAGSFYILDRNLIICSSNDMSQIGKRLKPFQEERQDGDKLIVTDESGQKYVMHREELPEIGGSIVSVFPVSELFSGLDEVNRTVVIILLLLLAVLLVFYYGISHNILQPVKTFMDFIYQIRIGDLTSFNNKRVYLEGYKEIAIMANKFNALLNEIDTLTENLVESRTQIVELQLLKKQAELAFLKSQINPHFLYNTLETIKGIAAYKEVDEIYEMANSLAEIFRYSIKGEEMVGLQEEIGMVESYVQIQQMRFQDRFEVIYDLAGEAFGCKVPKMILQPVIENAIFHGIEPKLGPSRLEIGCRVEAPGVLLLKVKDDGVGMSETTQERIRGHMAGSGPAGERENGHIGLANVDKRIKLAYGEAYGVTFASERDKGTEVAIKLPAGE